MTDFYKCLSSEFTRWVVDNDFLESDFVILDVGVQGGHHPRWNILGKRLSVYGFDPLREEIETLRAANPDFHYFDMAVGDEDGTQTLYVTETLWTSSFYKPPPQRNDRFGGSDPTLEEREVVTRRIDTLVAEGVIPPPDYIKMDVEGHEPKVILGGSDQLSGGGVLAVESESGFTAHPDAPLSHFALISEPLHTLGFYLYNIGLVHATKRPLAAGRPRVTLDLDVYFSPIGRPQTIDVLFSRDGVLEDWSQFPSATISDRLLKMAIILELYNLNDCAIELMQHVAADPALKRHLRFPIDEAIDRLVPTIEGNRFIGDESDELELGWRMNFETYEEILKIKAAQQEPKIEIKPDNRIALIGTDNDQSNGESATEPVQPSTVQPDEPETLDTNAHLASPELPSAWRSVLNKVASLERKHPITWFRRKIILPDGSVARRAGNIRGWVDNTIIMSGVVTISGWAADMSAGRPVERILVFADGRRVATGTRFIHRPDVALAFSQPEISMTGFRFDLMKRKLGIVEGLTLRAFAETEDGCSELRYPENYPFKIDDDPRRFSIRASSLAETLQLVEERRDQEVEARMQLRPRDIVIDPDDTLTHLDAHVPTFTDTTAKTRVPIDIVRDKQPAVLVTFGQSNIANHGNSRYAPTHEFYNFDFLSGDVFRAEDPLLGASGDLGNVATRLADKLIERKAFNSIVLVPLALGGSTVAEWTPDGFAHRRLLVAIQRLRARDLKPTHFLWHQGESDVVAETTQSAYEYAFRRIVESLRDHGAYAPVFVAVASRCGNDGSEHIRAAQQSLPNPHHNIFPGPDTDKLGPAYRFDDCHFSDRGLDAHADLWVDALMKSDQPKLG